MTAKNVLNPYTFPTSGTSMAASFTTPATDIRGLDNVWYHAAWTGTPNGAWAVQTSSDYVPGQSLGSTPQNAGTWTALPMSLAIVASGSADTGDWDLNQVGAPFVRLAYTASSGSGTATITISGKAV